MAIIGTVTGSCITVFKYEISRICRDISDLRKEVDEIHDKVFH